MAGCGAQVGRLTRAVRGARGQARADAKAERNKRKVAYLLTKGQAKAALRIQYAWWAYKVKLLAQRREAEEAALRTRVAEEEKQRQAVQRREEFIMAKPVEKKSRRLMTFQRKQMRIDLPMRKLNYWKYSEKTHATVKEIHLDHVVTIEQKDDSKFNGIVLGVKPDRTTRSYTFRMEDKLAADIWFKHIREATPNAAVIENRTGAHTPAGAHQGGGASHATPS